MPEFRRFLIRYRSFFKKAQILNSASQLKFSFRAVLSESATTYDFYLATKLRVLSRRLGSFVSLCEISRLPACHLAALSCDLFVQIKFKQFCVYDSCLYGIKFDFLTALFLPLRCE